MQFAADPLVLLEWTAVVLNVGFTIGIAWHRRWSWILGFVASAISIGLYGIKDVWAMTGLNVFYLVMAVYGWVQWGRTGNDGRIHTWIWKRHALVLTACALLAMGMYLVLRDALNGTFPGMDAYVTVLSVVATWMMARRILENWVYWIAADLVAVYFNWALGYHGFAVLYVLYMVLSTLGLVRWLRQWRAERVPSRP